MHGTLLLCTRCFRAQHYSDDEIASARREALRQVLDGWVGPTAADLMSCALGVPVHLIEPQPSCGSHNSLVLSSLRSSHGVHLCPPPDGWHGARDFTLNASRRALGLAEPIVLMHVIHGADAHESLLSGAQFNHWVPLLLEASFLRQLSMSSRGELDVDAIQLYRPAVTARSVTHAQAPAVPEGRYIIDLTSSHADHLPHQPQNAVAAEVQEVEGVAATIVGSSDAYPQLPCPSQSTRWDEPLSESQDDLVPAPTDCDDCEPGATPAVIQVGPEGQPAEGECVDVAADFGHMLDQTFQSAEECIKELRAVSDRHRCSVLVNRAKASYARACSVVKPELPHGSQVDSPVLAGARLAGHAHCRDVRALRTPSRPSQEFWAMAASRAPSREEDRMHVSLHRHGFRQRQ